MAAADLLAARAAGLRSSAIRDLLALTASADVLSLAGGLPAMEALPADDVARAVADELAAERGGLQYGPTEGEPALRRWIAEVELAGVEPDRVLVTHGSQQALRLLVEALVEPGDVVVVERPSYLGMLQALATSGASVVDVAADADGLVVDELGALLAAGLRPKLCYLAPTFQNPSGSVLPDARRAVLGELSARYGFVVVDDDPYRALGFDSVVPQRLRAFVPDDLAVTLGSFSKTLAPGLRVGWVHAPAWLVGPLTRLKQAADLHTTSLGQRVVTRLVSRPGWLEDAVALRRDLYRRRAAAAVAALRRHEPTLAVREPRGGMFLWVDLGVDTDDLLGEALVDGVAFVPGSAFDHQLRRSTFGRICFSTLDAPDLDEAARRLSVARGRLRGTIAARCPDPTPRS
jgi:2-aminoadipate transaminase